MNVLTLPQVNCVATANLSRAVFLDFRNRLDDAQLQALGQQLPEIAINLGRAFTDYTKVDPGAEFLSCLHIFRRSAFLHRESGVNMTRRRLHRSDMKAGDRAKDIYSISDPAQMFMERFRAFLSSQFEKESLTPKDTILDEVKTMVCSENPHLLIGGLRFISCEDTFANADFKSALAGRAVFESMILSGADFSDASLRRATFIDVDLEGTNFDRAVLRGFEGRNLRGFTNIPEGMTEVDVSEGNCYIGTS